MNTLFQTLVYWHWLALAVLLGIVDVAFGANFFLLWCGLSAALVGGILFLIPSMSWEFQFLIFGVGVFTSIFVWHKYLKTHGTPSDKPNLNRRAEQYIGREFTLEEPIVNGRGKVKVDDSTWRIEGEDLPIHTKIRVQDVDGVVLKVEKVNNSK